VRVQCGYMLSRDSLVSGVHRVFVHGGDVLNSGMAQHSKFNACGNISARCQNCVRWIFARDTKVVRSYWCNREVIHNGFKVRKALFTLCCCFAW
jgi:hypothetical protein